MSVTQEETWHIFKDSSASGIITECGKQMIVGDCSTGNLRWWLNNTEDERLNCPECVQILKDAISKQEENNVSHS